MVARLLRGLLEAPQISPSKFAPDPDDPRVSDLLSTVDQAEVHSGQVCVVVGVPQHLGVERNHGRPGAAEAPDAIRAAWYRMATSGIQDSVEGGRLCIADAGNLRTQGKTLEQIHDELHDVVARLFADNVFPIVIGGGHDTAWPSMRAYQTVGKPFGVVSIDAHADVRPLHPGSRAHSGSPFRQLLELQDSKLAPGGFVEFGLQPQAVAQAHVDFVRSRGMHTYMLDEAIGQGAWEGALAAAASPGRFHLSLDMDAFASAYAPGVSAASGDGFSPREVGRYLYSAAVRPELTSVDVVEVCPPNDVDGRTSKLAAAMIMQVLRGLANRSAP
jgi:formimidoylglutamase